MECLVGAELSSHEEHLERDGVGDLFRESDGGPAEGEESLGDFDDAEGGATSADADVGPLEDLGSTGECVSFNGGDDGFFGASDPQECALPELFVFVESALPFVFVSGDLFFEIGAGGEVSFGAGEDDDSDVGIGVAILEGVGDADHHLFGEGVSRARVVEGEDADVSAVFDEEVWLSDRLGVGHEVHSLGVRRSVGAGSARLRCWRVED